MRAARRAGNIAAARATKGQEHHGGGEGRVGPWAEFSLPRWGAGLPLAFRTTARRFGRVLS
jgi:hypothetical protein